MQKIILSVEDIKQLEQVSALKSEKLFDEAILILFDILQRYPEFAEGWNHLGSIYFAQAKWIEAMDAYQKATMIQADYIDAYYNLALVLTKLKKINDAMMAYQTVIQLNSEHAGAQFQLACLFMQKDQFQKALKYFAMVEEIYPRHFETQSNLATCFLKTGKWYRAIHHYSKALEVEPEDAQILFNLGVLHMQQGHPNEAIPFYLRANRVTPNVFAIHYNLGVAYLALKNQTEALLHFCEAERIEPSNESAHHMVMILTQQRHIAASPLPYVQSLFDAYADHYDAHLLQTLQYRVPAEIYDMIMPFCDSAKKAILDLGCGTGLCGELFKPIAHSLIGVDISKKMLEKAALKKKYDELIESDILNFLLEKQIVFDLIIAGDVLVYWGDLTQLFFSVAQALKPNGLFAFNVEKNAKATYEIMKSGRFAHGKDYIDQLARENGLRILQCQETVLRTQDAEFVLGYLYLLQKRM